MSASLAAILILVLPLLVFLLRVAVPFARRQVPVLASSVSVINLVLSAYILYEVIVGGAVLSGFTWLEFGKYRLNAGIFLDKLSASMLLVVWLVAAAVKFYSFGYMYGDRRFEDYYALLSLFAFSMSGLVISLSLIQVFIFWELVGVCSFLLIGFWFDRNAASRASIKAFIVTRLGDVAFFVGLLVLLLSFDTLDITALGHSFGLYLPEASLAALLIFIGAVGKSAQFPLHVWLPDAMEGPTPVSALIHAATMVAAGVYLIARVQFLFVDTSVRGIVLAIGIVTALVASIIAVFQRDIKRVLAFSTISQLGYMMAALGAGAFAYGIYHLYTHAFFKALLFLAAGNVFHAVHSLDITDAGGLIKKLKWTATLFLIGALNLAGFPLTGGFFSKESVLYGVKESGFLWAYYLLIAGVFLTSFYIFKVFFRVFLGAPGKNFEEAHESPSVMIVPMVVLALFSFGTIFLAFAHPLNEAARVHFSFNEAIPSLAASLVGILFAYVTYGLRKFEFEAFAAHAIYEFFYNRLYIDEFYEVVFLGGYRLLAKAAGWIDRYIIDGAVNGVAHVSIFLGQMVKRIESGLVQLYLFYTLVFVFLLALWLYWLGGRF